MTNKNVEIPIRIVCNTNHNNNTLNSFKESLPYELKFNEPYSIGLRQLVLPNSILNIRKDTVINFAFLRKLGHYPPNDTDDQVLYFYEKAVYLLVCSFSVKVIKSAYTSHLQFFDELYTQFLKTSYPDNVPTYSVFSRPLYYQLNHLNGDKLDSINLKSQNLIDSFISTVKDSGIKLSTLQKNIKNMAFPNIYNFSKIDNLNEMEKHCFEKLISKSCTFFWWKGDRDDGERHTWLYEKLKTFNFDMWPLNRSGDYFEHFKSRRENAIKYFTGIDVLKQALEFYVDNVWLSVCREKEKLKVSVTKFIKKTAKLSYVETLHSGLKEILNTYFDDLKLILEYIKQEIQETPYMSLDHFLRDNKEVYSYFMPPKSLFTKTKKRNVMQSELKYLFKRVEYDQERRKLHFTHLSGDYLKLASTLDPELTVFNTTGDVSVFLGHNNFRIKKSPYMCTYQPRVISDPEIYLYCRQIDEQMLNDQLVQLLHVVHADENTEYGGILQQTITRPIFLKLNNRYVQNFEFEFRTRDGELAKFDNTAETITLVLILRPTSKGCI